MVDTTNSILALLSIALGIVGWLFPRYTMGALDLTDGGSTMGTSEVRASAGCLFVGMGIGALIINAPAAFLMIGCCWTGAAVGRLTSLLRDGKSHKKWFFFGIEAVVGLLAIAINV